MTTKKGRHVCRDCGKSFPDGRKFESHACCTKLENLSLAELKKLATRRPPASPAAIKCPTCNGAGKQTVTITEFGKPGSTSTEMDCVACGGSGAVTKRRAAAIAAEDAAWCRCGDVGDNVRYRADGESKACRKHHWTHEPGCGRIVQVG